MDDAKQQDFLFQDVTDNEGLFDAQMTLPLSKTPWAAPVQEIIKRDGRRENFDKNKIAAAIMRAAPENGALDRETASGIASAVAIFLAKRLNGESASADQVSDAVERVLIQLAQADAALSYARFRDRRARIRRLRRGDMQSVLSELEEARHERMASLARDMNLHVQTSQDRLLEWDRSRIVEALQLETGLNAALANLIAAEVEKQIQSAGISALTAPLVRELVGAKLIEHGLTAENERRRRLGVPLYDAARIIRGRAIEAMNLTPGATDNVLARAVKKEYALSEVFSPPVTQAHLLGQLHLQALEFVDRLYGCELACNAILFEPDGLNDMFREFGTGVPAWAGVNSLLKHHDFLRQFCSASLQFQALNYLLAPFMVRADDNEMRSFARMFMLECAHRTRDWRMYPVRVSLHWKCPVDIRTAFGRAMAGEDDVVEPGVLESVARRLLAAFLDVAQQEASHGNGSFMPVLDLVLGPNIIDSVEGNAVCIQAVRTARCFPEVHFVIRDAPAAIPAGLRAPGEAYQNFIWHRVALNLPRAALSAADRESFWEELERLCALAVMAHTDKREFIEEILEPQGRGPLAGLGASGLTTAPFNSDTGLFIVDVDGLCECAEILVGQGKHLLAERVQFMSNVLSHLKIALNRCAKGSGLTCILSANADQHISTRFAAVDAGLYPDLIDQIIRVNPESQTLSYTSGAALPGDYGLSPFETAYNEGVLHKQLAGRQCTRLSMPIDNASENTLVDLLKKIQYQTDCREVVLSTSFMGEPSE